MTDKEAAKAANQTCSLRLTECLNCTSFTDMSSRIDAIESKVKMPPGTHLYRPGNLKKKKKSDVSDVFLSD